MRKLIVIAEDQYVRNLVSAGAFDEIEDDETYWISGRLRDPSPLEERGDRYLGFVHGTPERRQTYIRLRRLLLAGLRGRSRTQRIKLRFLPPLQRTLLFVQALPGLRQLMVRRYLRMTGRHESLHSAMERLKPDLVIAPSGGTDNLVFDTLRSARELGIRSLVVVYNWDNLSSKAAFVVRPDHIAVVGPQSKVHARELHGFDLDDVTVLGGPYIDHHFFHEPGSTTAPFPFPYVLYAGCYMPFDERTSLERLNAYIAQAQLDLTIVYRPHPQRRKRKVNDEIDESRLEHVVIDPQVREAYRASFDRPLAEDDERPPLPPLDYYPALLENAEFVICPLSTMVLEAAIFERPVLVVAYHDGIHKDSPGVVVGYDHFQGMDSIDGIHLCRTEDDMEPVFARLAAGERPARPMRDQVAPWVFHDERPYRRRLRELVDRLDSSMSEAHRQGTGLTRV